MLCSEAKLFRLAFAPRLLVIKFSLLCAKTNTFGAEWSNLSVKILEKKYSHHPIIKKSYPLLFFNGPLRINYVNHLNLTQTFRVVNLCLGVLLNVNINLS